MTEDHPHLDLTGEDDQRDAGLAQEGTSRPLRWLPTESQHRPRLLSRTDVMRWLGVSRNTFYRLVEGGELPSVRIRGCIRVSTEDLLAFIQNNRVGPMN